MNNEQITEIAMLTTFLGDQEITDLAKNPEFQNFIALQKRSLTNLIKNSFALSQATASMNTNIQSTSVVVPSPKVVDAIPNRSKIYIPDVSSKTSETLTVTESTNKSIPTSQTAQTSELSQNEILRDIVQLFADKTGYPSDMLEPNLDLEADLGIDTVKQMEILGQIRQKYNIRLKEGFSLKQTPNIDSIVNLVIAG